MTSNRARRSSVTTSVFSFFSNSRSTLFDLFIDQRFEPVSPGGRPRYPALRRVARLASLAATSTCRSALVTRRSLPSLLGSRTPDRPRTVNTIVSYRSSPLVRSPKRNGSRVKCEKRGFTTTCRSAPVIENFFTDGHTAIRSVERLYGRPSADARSVVSARLHRHGRRPSLRPRDRRARAFRPISTEWPHRIRASRARLSRARRDRFSVHG